MRPKTTDPMIAKRYEDESNDSFRAKALCIGKNAGDSQQSTYPDPTTVQHGAVGG